MKNILITISIVFVLFVLLGEDDETIQLEKKQVKDTCAIVTDEGVEDMNVFFGDVITNIQLRPSFRVAGTIGDKYFKRGDYVNKGDVLAELDDANYLLSAENILEQWNRTVARIDEVDAELVNAEVSLTNLVKRFSRIEELYYEGDVSKVNYLEAKRNMDSAEAKLSQVKESRKAALSTLTELQPQVSQAKENFNNTKLISPEDGFILSEEKEKGETVVPGTHIYTISFGDSLEAKTCIPASLAGNLSIGQNVSAEVNGIPRKKYLGMIKKIGLSSTEVTSGVPLHVGFSGENGSMKPGMSVKITINPMPN